MLPSGHSYLIRCAAEKTDVAVVTIDDFDIEWNQVIDNGPTVEIILYDSSEKVDAISTRKTDFRDLGEGSTPATADISKILFSITKKTTRPGWSTEPRESWRSSI